MEEKDLYSEISSIRTLMERSTKFISLSGLSGVMAGIYALVGAGIAYKLLYLDHIELYVNRNDTIMQLFFVALIVLILSVATGIWLTVRKAKRKGQSVWNQSSNLLLKNGALPLLTGGCFVLLLFIQGHFGIIAPGCLIFYGLALVAASQYTYGDVRWLGLSEIALGLLATILPGYGLYFWALGFGVLHILYGSVMYFKYDRENNAN
ncbi:hypothetical protein [Mucilaginibacter jinjuensis]|uniref:DUF308 domain-containing protein n=1 Tax=Mucilaginibacter jinjuensis TaxID=1176721 RepID=A0ABY7T5R7_9SPHI|nr:hypothetical protein [Mucilaginibacter jinjuensis]WCT11052.1 hypothetical protein PQO05_20140 [Mucilaginibacter jinjuensis]